MSRQNYDGIWSKDPKVFQETELQKHPKNRLSAALLGIFFGGFGLHRFYLGYRKIAWIQVLVTIVTCGLGSIWGFVEGFLILFNIALTTDSNGNPLAAGSLSDLVSDFIKGLQEDD